MFRIGTNYQSMVAQRNLGNVANRESGERTKLASGSRIYQSAVDPAGLAIATGMRAKSVSNLQVQRNVNDGVSLLQVAEGTLSVMADISGRLRELAMQAANDTVSASDRNIGNKEFQQLTQEMKRLTQSTKYNGKHIINGQGSVYDIQIGVNNGDNDKLKYDLKKVLASADNFGLNGANILSKESARNTFSKIDKMTNDVSSSRANLGAAMNRMESVLQNLQVHHENIESSKSKIMDTDVAKVSTKLAKDAVLKNAATAMLAQANTKPGMALKLIEA